MVSASDGDRVIAAWTDARDEPFAPQELVLARLSSTGTLVTGPMRTPVDDHLLSDLASGGPHFGLVLTTGGRNVLFSVDSSLETRPIAELDTLHSQGPGRAAWNDVGYAVGHQEVVMDVEEAIRLHVPVCDP
jgi:hypothetical protein